MTREDHLEWAKERALAELKRTSGFAGWIMFKHDMNKHTDTAHHPALEIGDKLVKIAAASGVFPESLRVLDYSGPLDMRRFIEGFN